MKNKNIRGEVITGFILIGMWVAGLFGLSVGYVAMPREDKLVSNIYKMSVDYDGKTTNVCYEGTEETK